LVLPPQTAEKTASRIRFSLLPVATQSAAIWSVILHRPGNRYPSAKRGIASLTDALDVNWGARMSEVQVTSDPCFTELHRIRPVHYCIAPAVRPAISIARVFFFSRFGRAKGLPTACSPAVGDLALSCLSRTCQTQAIEPQFAVEQRQCAEVAVSRPSADIFVELSKASAGVRGSSRLTVPRCSASADSRTGNVKLRYPNASERGLKRCR